MKEIIKEVRFRQILQVTIAVVPPVLLWYLPDIWNLVGKNPLLTYRISLAIFGGMISFLFALIKYEGKAMNHHLSAAEKYEKKLKLNLVGNILYELESTSDPCERFIANIMLPQAKHFHDIYSTFVEKKEITERTDYLVSKVAETILKESSLMLILDQDISRWANDFQGHSFAEDSLSKEILENSRARGESGDLRLQRVFAMRKHDYQSQKVQAFLKAIPDFCVEKRVEMKVCVIDDHPHLKTMVKNMKDFVLFSLGYGKILFQEDIYFDQRIPSKDTHALVTCDQHKITTLEQEFKQLYRISSPLRR